LFHHKSLALRNLIAPLAQWPSETVAICFAVALFPTIIAIGAIVDYSRADSYKAAIQRALNAALLSGGRDGGTNWTDIALNTFNAELSSAYDLRPKPTFVQDPSTGNYIGSVTDSWPTSALGIINIGSIGVTVTGAAVADNNNAFILNRDHTSPKSHIWDVNKLSGNAFLTDSAGRQTALKEGAALNPGDNIRTGQNGRALLVRGQETILIASSSVVGIPTHAADGMLTTIDLWAGSIVLAVEKRNHVHFEVDTPHLAAVVRGTRFRVTANKDEANVKVLRGQVEVTDFRSGQYALVLPGQAAEVSAQGLVGLSLSGPGTVNPVRQGLPRVPPMHPVDLSSQRLSVENGRPNNRQGDLLSNAKNEWVPLSPERVPSNDDLRSFGPNSFGQFFTALLDQSNSAIFYVIFAGVLGAAVGAATNWFRHRSKQKSI
jgi:FecR protein/Putative Flp pilus-assembly TadE/G-like